MKHVPELNSPSDLCTRHRDTQEYQILRRQPPLWSRIHESLDVCDGGIQPQRSSFGLRGFNPASDVFDLRMWEPEGFRRLDGQVIWVVGSGSASALEGKVMAPLGWCWSFALFVACGKWEREGEFGSE
jgi:hypothetical protein